MLVEYYKDPNLVYASRKRLSGEVFSKYEPFNTEKQGKVIFGDGANTSLKTSVDNICDYVRLTDKRGNSTRWFVTSYTYLNGEQVILNLQRDVVGENGVVNCFGKIERGWTNSILKNRKELSLNEILKRRIPIRQSGNIRGDYTIETNNELWGVLYLAKPSNGQHIQNINIPAFAPEYETYINPPLNGETVITNRAINSKVQFYVLARLGNNVENDLVRYGRYLVTIDFYYDNGEWIREVGTNTILESYEQLSPVYRDVNSGRITTEDTVVVNFGRPLESGNVPLTYESLRYCVWTWINSFCNNAINNDYFPEITDYNKNEIDFTGKTVEDSGTVYQYSSVSGNYNKYGTTDAVAFVSALKQFRKGQNIIITNYNNVTIGTAILDIKDVGNVNTCSIDNYATYWYRTYSREVVGTTGGDITVDFSWQLIDEPYTVLLFPLFDGSIYKNNQLLYSLNRSNAFTVFNTVIQALSGENGYVVDAQIIPYCPYLSNVNFDLENDDNHSYPFFGIASNTFEFTENIDVGALDDVKKEYMIHKYSITSPEQSSNFEFNFYDYKLHNTDLAVTVKVALKPFAIISSAVIERDNEENLEFPLIGINYRSDLRGSQPSSNGFQCSLASNAFETYKRQNSNYQQIFNLSKEELRITHDTEKVNEATSGVVNTITATMMGAIGGASLADVSYFGSSARAAGAIVGAAASGTTVGGAMATQYAQNEKLREYEERLQQQKFDLTIGTIKAIPNTINRVSSFNEIILRDFYYVIECYECSEYEKQVVDRFIEKYGYGIGVYDDFDNFKKNKWFLRGNVITSSLITNLHNILVKELAGGIYLYEQE